MRDAKLAAGLAAAALLVAGSIPVLALAAAAPVSTAPAASGSGLSSNQPVDITADEAEVQQEQRKVTWRGNVEAIQGQNRLRTPVLVVYYSAKDAAAAATNAPAPAPKVSDSPTSPGNSIERMEAQGPVYFVTPTQTAKGDAGVYTAVDDSIVLTGNVVLVQDRNVAKGDKLTIHQKTGQSVLVSNAKGRGTPGRVRGVFYPSQAQTAGTPPAAGAAPSVTAPKPGAAR